MNLHVADPHWGVWIIAYFFLGGIAAGAYATAAMARLFGKRRDQDGVRAADYLAFPLVCLCGVILIIDLNRPERFWHMLMSSQTLMPIFKWWSPMSVGSWGLSLFAFFSGLSFLAVLVEDDWCYHPRLTWIYKTREGRLGKLISLVGLGSAFFLGSYTGVLLAATNQPGWVETPWLASLFLASSASTGLSAIALANRWFFREVSRSVLRHVERADRWAISLELIILCIYVWSLGSDNRRILFSDLPGWLIPWVVVPGGLLLPLALMSRHRRRGMGEVAAILVLTGGLILRYAIISIPGSLVYAHSLRDS